MKLSLLLGVFIAGLLVGTTTAGEKKSATKPIEIRGELAADDPKDAKLGGPSKTHKFKLEKEVPYVIDLVSTDFDCYLRLLDSNGEQLAEDDDGGVGLNSRLAFTPKKAGEYQVVATSFDLKTGKYVLTVQSPNTAAKKLQLADNNVTVTDKLDQADAKNVRGGLPNRCKVYSVELKADTKYVFDLESARFDAYLVLQDPAGKVLAVDDDGGDDLNSRIRFECPTAGSYVIVATGLGDPLGEFTLKIRKE